MKWLRNYTVPFLGLLALTALFLKLPEVPNIFGLFKCKTCTASDPFLPLIGAGYFAALTAVSLLFPSFPSLRIARGGLVWAVLLALAMTYLHLPSWCPVCWVAHMCNILIWAIWVYAPNSEAVSRQSSLRERLCLLLFAPISVIALFSCLNLTFMAYSYKNHRNAPISSLKAGDAAPVFNLETAEGRAIANRERAILNFISPDCPYSKEQLKILNRLQPQLQLRFINVTPSLSAELKQASPNAEWVVDNKNELRKLFKVKGYPTLFVLKEDGAIAKVVPGLIPGLIKEFETDLLTRSETN